MNLIRLNLSFRPVCLCGSSLSLPVTGLIYQQSAAGPEQFLSPWHKFSASPFTMSHTLHKPTTSQSGCQAVVPAAQPPVGNGVSLLSSPAHRPQQQQLPPSELLLQLRMVFAHSQEALAALVISAVPGFPYSHPWPGTLAKVPRRGALHVPGSAAEYFVFCYVTLQIRWYQNSSGQSMEGKDCLCPDKKTVSKNRKFGREDL